jgi:hypothetical protein
MFSASHIVWVHRDLLDNEETRKGVKSSSPCGSRGVYGLTAAITVSYLAAESMDVRSLVSDVQSVGSGLCDRPITRSEES